MHPVVQVIPVVIADINVIGGIPVLRPVSWPRVNHHEGKATVLEAGVTRNYIRLAVDAKPVFVAEIEAETSFWDVVAPIAPSLFPITVIASPIRGTISLPSCLSLPAAMLSPAALLLPGLRLLPGALRRGIASVLSGGIILLCGLLVLRLLLLGMLLLWLPLLRLGLLLGLLGMLLLWLPLLRLRLLLGLLSMLRRLGLLLGLLSMLLWLRLLLRLLSMLLRLGLLLGLLSMLLWLRLLLFGLGLLFVSLLLLSVDLDDSSGKRNKGGQGHYSKKFHVDSRFFGIFVDQLNRERSNVQARCSTFCADSATFHCLASSVLVLSPAPTKRDCESLAQSRDPAACGRASITAHSH